MYNSSRREFWACPVNLGENQMPGRSYFFDLPGGVPEKEADEVDGEAKMVIGWGWTGCVGVSILMCRALWMRGFVIVLFLLLLFRLLLPLLLLLWVERRQGLLRWRGGLGVFHGESPLRWWLPGLR